MISTVLAKLHQNLISSFQLLLRNIRTMMMMKLPILPCAEKLELVLSTAPRTWGNTDKNSKNRKRSH